MSTPRRAWLASPSRRPVVAAVSSVLLTVTLLQAALAWPDAGAGPLALPLDTQPGVDHLVISEVITGGASASDEFVEIYNPTGAELPIEGLELVYVTASGATITRKFAWPAGALPLPAGSHLLIANEAGVFASVADVTYASGLAATGGSVAIRIVGAATAIDAVGWGTAGSTWLETTPAAAPAVGHSLERLPGGGSGSGQDTGNNLVDFVDRDLPDPQNSGSPPIPVATPEPTPTPSPTPAGTASPTPSPTPTPIPTVTQNPTPSPSLSPSPTPAPTASAMSIADARALPDGAEVTIEGVALTAGDFTDGGGYVADASGGIAVLVSDGSFARGSLLRVTGTLDDRYRQRTIRAESSGIALIGTGTDPLAQPISTGLAGEDYESELVQAAGVIQGAPTSLSAGLAFEVDDGSGAVRVLVGTATGIDAAGWEPGASVTVIGVLGQRDSTGTGTSGYRVQPRDSADVLAVEPPPAATPTPTPSPAPSGGATATPSPTSPPQYATIAQARAAATGTQLTVRGVVTMPPGLVDPESAFLQDGSGAILLRLSDDVGSLALGDEVEVSGIRSTKSGMLALRVSEPPIHLGQQPQPAALRASTGALGEPQEALLVAIRGAVAGTPRKSSAQNVYFDLDDGSGPMRIYLSAQAGIGSSSIQAGAWIEIVGVLAQETTGRQPERGYRVWPRRQADVTVLAAPVAGGSRGASGSGASGSGTGAPGHPTAGSGVGGPASALAAGMLPPRLALALPTHPPAGPTSDPSAPPAPSTGSPWAIIGLLGIAAVLLAGGATLAVRPGMVARLLAAAEALRKPRQPTDNEAEPRNPTDAAGSEAFEVPAQLVPLAVVEPSPHHHARGTSVIEIGARRDRGRILPPT